MKMFHKPYVTPLVEEIKINYNEIVCTSPSAETEPIGEDIYSEN